MVKYAPRKVYIRESGGYVELSYTEFCRCRESDQTYMDKLFITIQGCLLEVVREQYADFYRDRERWRYLQKLDDFGVNVSAIDIASIEIDKTSDGYRQLKAVTQDLATATTQAQVEVDIKNMHDIQRINATNMEENLRIQREETQYAQRKQTQSSNFATYQLEQQAAVGIAGAEALGQMGMNGGTEITGCGGMNPVTMMAGMAMGGVIGQNMAGMMNGMIHGINDPQLVTQQSPQGIVPPPIPNVNYYVVQNGQATGPFDLATLSHMISTETLIKDSLVWKQGMPDWVKAETLEDFRVLFNSSASLLPPIPPQV